MEMKREFLKELGLNDEVIEKIMAEHGKTVNSMKDELDKVKDYQSQIEDLKSQLKDRDKQLEDLSAKVKGNEELKSEIERLKEENKKVQQEYEEKIRRHAFDFALERALINAKARNPKAVKALLDTEKISLKDGNLEGLEEQLKALQESDAYLFESVDQPAGLKGRTPHPSDPNKLTITKNPFSKEYWNLTEQGRLFREDPELYKQLKAQAGK
jgi:DNA repair exonuclease SbcCD ATPase subunit